MQKYVIALYIRLSIEDYKYDSVSKNIRSFRLCKSRKRFFASPP